MLGNCNKTHGDPCHRDYRCLRKLKSQYRFYLAFENALCQEYITEKFWKALNEGMVSDSNHFSFLNDKNVNVVLI